MEGQEMAEADEGKAKEFAENALWLWRPPEGGYIGRSGLRPKEALEKVTGRAVYVHARHSYWSRPHESCWKDGAANCTLVNLIINKVAGRWNQLTKPPWVWLRSSTSIPVSSIKTWRVE